MDSFTDNTEHKIDFKLSEFRVDQISRVFLVLVWGNGIDYTNKLRPRKHNNIILLKRIIFSKTWGNAAYSLGRHQSSPSNSP